MALNFKITYSTLGLSSLKDIHNYLEYHIDIDTADRIIVRIGKFISNNMPYNPFMGRILSEYKLKTKDVRRITAEKRYNIYYRVDEQAQQIYILKIVDGKQSIKRQLHGL